jgi:hypothetical protein
MTLGLFGALLGQLFDFGGGLIAPLLPRASAATVGGTGFG